MKFFFTVLFIFFSGCASSPDFSRFPEEAINRNATLPAGIASWRLIYGQSLDREPNHTVFPFYWENGFTDRLTLVWTPLPLTVRYLFSDGITGEVSFLGSPYSREKNFVWRPALQLDGRKQVNPWLAFDARILLQYEIKRSAEQRVSRTAGLRTGPFIQISKRCAFSPSLWILNEMGETRALYLGEIPHSNTGASSSTGTRWRVPLSLDASVTLSRQWELLLNLNWFRLGYESGYTGSSLFTSLVHYW